MKARISEVGRVVVSIQGHDAGRWYCVISFPMDGMLLCCDGFYRKLDQPKKKQIKHLISLPYRIDISGKGGSGGAFTDGDLHKALKEIQKKYESETEWPSQYAESVIKETQKEECALVQK